MAALETASTESWARYEATHSPQHIFSFAGDPALVRAVQQAWLNPDAEAEWMLETLEQTLTINQLWVTGQNWQSNQTRANFNKRNLARYWDAEEDKPRVFFKFGAGHMVRGLSHTQSHDIGSRVAEMAEMAGGKSFHLLVLPGAGAEHAQFDPVASPIARRPAAPTRS